MLNESKICPGRTSRLSSGLQGDANTHDPFPGGDSVLAEQMGNTGPATSCKLVEMKGLSRADGCVMGKQGPKAAKELLNGRREVGWAWE